MFQNPILSGGKHRGIHIQRVVEVDSRRRNAAPLKGQISKLTAKLIEGDDLVTVIE